MATPTKQQLLARRGNRVRQQIGDGTAARPRLAVFRSNASLVAQLIDDKAAKTLAEVNSLKEKNGSNVAAAEKLGKALAAVAKKAKVETVIFDRNGYAYHGVVKAFADAARAGGLQF